MVPTSATGSFWICPSCHRHVPQRVAECRCGTPRDSAPAADHRAAPAAPDRSGPPWIILIGVVAGALVAAYAVDRLYRPADKARRQASDSAPPSTEPPRPRPSARLPEPRAAAPQRPSPDAFPSAGFGFPIPALPATGGGSRDASGSDPADAGADPSSVEAIRKRGEAALDQALRTLAGKAAQLVARVRFHKANCAGGGATFVGGRDCQELLGEMEQLAMEVGAGLEATEDEARSSLVEPGTVRDVRKKYGLDAQAWDDLAEAVHKASQ